MLSEIAGRRAAKRRRVPPGGTASPRTSLSAAVNVVTAGPERSSRARSNTRDQSNPEPVSLMMRAESAIQSTRPAAVHVVAWEQA